MMYRGKLTRGKGSCGQSAAFQNLSNIIDASNFAVNMLSVVKTIRLYVKPHLMLHYNLKCISVSCLNNPDFKYVDSSTFFSSLCSVLQHIKYKINSGKYIKVPSLSFPLSSSRHHYIKKCLWVAVCSFNVSSGTNELTHASELTDSYHLD